MIAAAAAGLFFISCRELSRNNPYDPASDEYINVTYEGEVTRPAGMAITTMILSQGGLVIGGTKDGYGDCVMRLPSPAAETGTFTGISDMCGDTAGNIYIVDSQPSVQVFTPSDTFLAPLSITYTAGIDRMYIEFFNGNLFITNNLDKRIYKYSTAGAQAGYADISYTASGSFTPGRIFKSSQNMFVINGEKRSEVIKIDENMNILDVYDIGAETADGAPRGSLIEVLCSEEVQRTDNSLALDLRWGNFGTGPGRVLNGKVIAYNPVDFTVYILDGNTIKMFGE